MLLSTVQPEAATGKGKEAGLEVSGETEAWVLIILISISFFITTAYVDF